MADSIFTKIIKGEIPCHKIYEDETTFAFLDIHPVQPGHTLVVPKRQVVFLWDLDEADYSALMESVRKIAQHMRQVIGKPYVGVQVIGIDVPHAHVHLIPFSTTEEFRVRPNMHIEPDHEALSKIAAKLVM
jgi:histidine triad (HIT) family protein